MHRNHSTISELDSDGNLKKFLDKREALIVNITVMGRSREEAEDIVQETYIRLLRNGHFDDPEANIIALAKATGRRLVLNKIRDAKRGDRNLKENKDSLVVESVNAEAALIVASTAHEVLAAVSQLSTARKVLVIGAYWEEKTQTEQAAEHNLNQGTVNSRLQRAKEDIKRILTTA